MKPAEIIKVEKENVRKKLSVYFGGIQDILDEYEETTGDHIKDVVFRRVDPKSYGDYATEDFVIGGVDLIFY